MYLGDGTFLRMDSDESLRPDPSEEPDEELIKSITPNVMSCLVNCGYFEELDNRLCPADTSKPREHCQGNFNISESILQTHDFDNESLADIFDVLKAQGGFCDCEVLYNVVETNRLKAEYWRSRANESNPAPIPHSSE